MDKRQLIPQHWTDEEIESMADRCFLRLWGNHESVYREAGFEEAFAKKFNDFKKV